VHLDDHEQRSGGASSSRDAHPLSHDELRGAGDDGRSRSRATSSPAIACALAPLALLLRSRSTSCAARFGDARAPAVLVYLSQVRQRRPLRALFVTTAPAPRATGARHALTARVRAILFRSLEQLFSSTCASGDAADGPSICLVRHASPPTSSSSSSRRWDLRRAALAQARAPRRPASTSSDSACRTRSRAEQDSSYDDARAIQFLARDLGREGVLVIPRGHDVLSAKLAKPLRSRPSAARASKRSSTLPRARAALAAIADDRTRAFHRRAHRAQALGSRDPSVAR
jgi:hypothetical protein